MKNLILPVIALLFFGCGTSGQKTVQNEISLETIQSLFDRMQSQGINTDTLLLYGYFFNAKNKADLQNAVSSLKELNLRYVNVYPADSSDLWWLHMERIETNSPQSLFDFNKKLYSIANRYHIVYDGYDVGNADPSKALQSDPYKVPEDFSVVDSIINGYPQITVINTAFSYFLKKTEFPVILKITQRFPFQQAGLPSAAEMEGMENTVLFIENKMENNKITHYYIYRELYKGSRVDYLAVNSQPEVEALIKSLKSEHQLSNIQFDFFRDENWKFYNKALNRVSREKMPQ
ncbi:ribonuclease E inhibitor RraB [Niabella sp. CJ426]|uniref:ribonuclease E inhibitor RraB n=1 Tax=Niabella sp. CJ426 TaxID=3393740 RepID=UPI003CFD92FF